MEKTNDQPIIKIKKPTITLKPKVISEPSKIKEEDKIKFNLKIEDDDYGLKILTPLYGSDKIVISNNIRKYMGGVSKNNGK